MLDLHLFVLCNGTKIASFGPTLMSSGQVVRGKIWHSDETNVYMVVNLVYYATITNAKIRTYYWASSRKQTTQQWYKFVCHQRVTRSLPDCYENLENDLARSSGALIDCWSVRRSWQLDCKRFITNRGDIVSATQSLKPAPTMSPRLVMKRLQSNCQAQRTDQQSAFVNS
ncbi:hypothetical protein CLF_101345 [Clonorchis sinensis]|uniref:Uncharacterized protein n=1 Tax=Clonorchis sinensis TaxID=79923 RepID=G7Y5J4_CLOSI|nr:hypothetical protein CLF_101345 [Clonorchis sinensis]